ncbi:uncharacterized protein LOC111254366 [Varroa destructor]|uniref:Uncharacterized protein n=1 Tax=Varroa destructor TaxID=109461 RepID=A0A7M7KUJ3_VARDE|nr:uncharacterized protein LOC111254366 [Varroa destructor]XP_022670848.1 uncharacterized protein LOC111254366 [Varroa destructor]XP_022670849.1 uncharacterized protein LOC111254366 [Varroa destructor]XP_022670850.1 uncharacterized protein LOC111254366 [Varroa destructor]
MCLKVRAILSNFFCPPTTFEEIEEREARAERVLRPISRGLLRSLSALAAYIALACILDWDNVAESSRGELNFPVRLINISVDITGEPLMCPEYRDHMGERYMQTFNFVHSKDYLVNEASQNKDDDDDDNSVRQSFRIAAISEKYPYLKRVLCNGRKLSVKVASELPIQRRLRVYATYRKLRRKSDVGEHFNIVLINLSSSFTFMVKFSLIDSKSHRQVPSKVSHLDKLFINFPHVIKVYLPLFEIQSLIRSVRRARPKYPTCDPGYNVSSGVLEAVPAGISVYRIGKRPKYESLKEDCF